MDTTIDEAVYNVVKLDRSMKIDANWDKEQWKNVQSIRIEKKHGRQKNSEVPDFTKHIAVMP